jgi:hypothetical protein
MEGLNKETNCEPTPAADEVFRRLPEEDRYATSYDAGDDAGEDEETAQGFRGWVDGLEDAKANDEGSTSESKRIEATDEVGRPL